MPVTLYLSAPPASQYQRGATLAIEAETVAVATAYLDEYLEEEGIGKTLVQDIVGSNLAKAVLKGAPEAPRDAKAENQARPVTTPHATEPDPNGAASAGLLSVVAKKTGKTVAELGELTTEQAKALLKEAKSA